MKMAFRFFVFTFFFLLLFLTNTRNIKAAIPTYKGSGTFTVSTTVISPPFPTGGAAPVANDVCLLVLESENQAITLSNAQGFAEITSYSPQSAGTAATSPGTRLAVFWKRAVGSDVAPTMADSGDHNTGRIHCFSGVTTSGNPWDIGAGGNDSAANDTSGTIPGATTTTNDALVVLITSVSVNSTSTVQCSAWANADLTNITEIADNINTAGLGGGHCMATGQKANFGAYGTTTLTLAGTSYKGTMSLALKPPTVSVVTTGTDPSNSTIAPSSGVVDSGSFTLKTTNGSDSVTALSLVLNTSGTPYDGLSEVSITSDDGSTSYFSTISNPSSNTLNFSGGTPIPISTTSTQFKIRILPKTHTNMPLPNGSSYSLSTYVSSFTTTNTQSGSDTNSNVITIDNLSPNNASGVSGSSSDSATTLNWTSSSSSDFDLTNGSVILRWASSSAGSEVPAEGVSNYTSGESIGTAVVACVISSSSSSSLSKQDGLNGSAGCTTNSLTNGQTYSYKVFQRDINGNYDIGTSIGSLTPVIVSITISTDGTINYGIVALSSSKDTTSTGVNDTQIILNDGTGPEDFAIKTSNATGGTLWTLGPSVNNNVYVHEFSINNGGLWTKFISADSFQTLTTNVGVSASQSFDLRITAPSTSTDYQEKNILVTILATQH